MLLCASVIISAMGWFIFLNFCVARLLYEKNISHICFFMRSKLFDDCLKQNRSNFQTIVKLLQTISFF